MLEPLLESTPTETEMHSSPLTVCLRVELQTTRDLVAATDHYLSVDEVRSLMVSNPFPCQTPTATPITPTTL